ncbi:MAG: SH3 domain-containing protein [Clostridia bacterium]|nr:SH3 domain-containing protein [Clostridia bacterium]
MSAAGKLKTAVSLLLLFAFSLGCGAQTASLPSPSTSNTVSASPETAQESPRIEVYFSKNPESPETSPSPSAETTPTSGFAAFDGLPTPTPRQTFVPLPPSSPELLEDGTTPSPTPPWATPYPSPTGEPTIVEPDAVLLARVVNCEEYVRVRAQAGRSADILGTAALNTRYLALSHDSNWVCINFNGRTGYISADYIELETADTRQSGLVSYTLCSLNVHNMGNGERIDETAHLLQNANADIICIQEVDVGTRRSDGRDCARLLAEALGYPYYAFSEATGYEGGSFGTAIISRYPLIDSRTIALDVAEGKERRSLGYARILLDNGAVSVFNTHLCPSSMCFKSVNLASLQYELQASGVKIYTVAGDFNCSPPRLYEYLPNLYAVNMDKSTFGDGTVPKILDNILYTDGIIPTDFAIIDARSSDITDHDMVYCRILIPEASA